MPRGETSVVTKREALTLKENERLDHLVSVVRKGMRTFKEVGFALIEINQKRLYRETHDNFDDFCKETFGFGRQYAHRLMTGAETATTIQMSPIGDRLPAPTHESQVRPLAGVAPGEQAELWAQASAAAGGAAPTARQVEEAVHARKGDPSIQTMRTPRWLFDELNRLFGPFVLDAFASPHNALCDNFYTEEDDGCTMEWADVTFGNPEFEDMDRPLDWAVKQAALHRRSLIVAPVGCSQQWYHRHAIQGTINVPDCRINYDNPDGTPSTRAKHDTIFIAFGGQWVNPKARDGIFRVRRLPIAHLRPVMP